VWSYIKVIAPTLEVYEDYCSVCNKAIRLRNSVLYILPEQLNFVQTQVSNQN